MKIALYSILVRSSLNGTEPSENVFSRIKLGSVSKFPVKSSDLTEYFSGPKLGEMLAYLEQKWIESEFTLNKKKLVVSVR